MTLNTGMSLFISEGGEFCDLFFQFRLCVIFRLLERAQSAIGLETGWTPEQSGCDAENMDFSSDRKENLCDPVSQPVNLYYELPKVCLNCPI
jgi:hypothetical protein